MPKSENNPDTIRTNDGVPEVRYDVPVQTGPDRYTSREQAHLKARENELGPYRWSNARESALEERMGPLRMVEKIEVLAFRLNEEKMQHNLDNNRLSAEVERLRAGLEGMRRKWHDDDDDDDSDSRGPCPDADGGCWCGTANWNATIDAILNPLRSSADWRMHHQRIAARETLRKIDNDLSDLHQALLELGSNDDLDGDSDRANRQEMLRDIKEHEIWRTNLLNKHSWLLEELQGQEDPF